MSDKSVTVITYSVEFNEVSYFTISSKLTAKHIFKKQKLRHFDFRCQEFTVVSRITVVIVLQLQLTVYSPSLVIA